MRKTMLPHFYYMLRLPYHKQYQLFPNIIQRMKRRRKIQKRLNCSSEISGISGVKLTYKTN